jgi:Uri superfamily endonuclease
MPLDPTTQNIYLNEWRQCMAGAERIGSHLKGFRQNLVKRWHPDYPEEDAKITFNKMVNDDTLEGIVITLTFKIFNNKGYYSLFASAIGSHGDVRQKVDRWVSVSEDPIAVLNELISKFPPQYRKYFAERIQPQIANLEKHKLIYSKIKKIKES